jgi:hypothetical protein
LYIVISTTDAGVPCAFSGQNCYSTPDGREFRALERRPTL